MSGFSIPSARIWSIRQSGRSKAQMPGGSKERTSASAFSTSASFVVAGVADLLARDPEVPVLVDVADQVRRDLADGRDGVGHRELPGQVLLEARRARERVLERGLLALLVLPRVVGACRGSPRSRSRSRSRRRSRAPASGAASASAGASGVADDAAGTSSLAASGASAASPGLRLLRRLVLLLVLLEDGVLDHLLGQDLFELELGHLQQLDRLLQRRRHDQPLRKPEVEFLFERHQDFSRPRFPRAEGRRFFRHRLFSSAEKPPRDRSS